MSLVLDGSMALAWCFEDESSPFIDSVMRQVARAGALVPTLWRLEVANALQTAIRRRRISPEQRDGYLQALADMSILSDPETDRYAWSSTLRIAERHALTIYDSAYLELAQRCNLPLASLDRDLCRAAQTIGVPLLTE